MQKFTDCIVPSINIFMLLVQKAVVIISGVYVWTVS